VAGVSGSGKTLSSLKLARGMGLRTAMIDTEHGSGELYADYMDFDCMQLLPPYTVDRYIAGINDAANEGYPLLIIDSASHAWFGEGGVLELAEASDTGKNPYGGWSKATPEHRRLLTAFLSFPGHLIATFRKKTVWEVITNERGKKAPQKIGLAPITKVDTDYEFTIFFDIDRDSHNATTSKDRTGLFDTLNEPLTEEHGAMLMEWLQSGITVDEEVELLYEDALKNIGNVRAWYKENMGRIKRMPKDLQDSLVGRIKQVTTPLPVQTPKQQQDEPEQ
jgi:hypothetical protein